MTPKSDHEEDMSMDEILASIRKFVTDNPPENFSKRQSEQTQSASASPSVAYNQLREQPRGASSSAAPIPTGLSMFQEPIAGVNNQASAPIQTGSQTGPVQIGPVQESGHESEELSHASPVNFRSSRVEPQSTKAAPDNDILELTSPIGSAGPHQHTAWTPPSRAIQHKKSLEESIMTLSNPLDSKKSETPLRVSPRASQLSDHEDSIGSSQAVAASASSLSRLAQASKTASKRPPSLADQRNVTLDQLIQDLIRPMIKQWIDTHLPSLVEEMVAKEIKRITKHLG